MTCSCSPCLRTVLACAGIILLAATAFAAEDDAAEDDAGEERPHHIHGHHKLHPNHIGLFLGVTAGGEAEGHGEESRTATIALDYERRFTRLFGAGAIVEFAGGERRDWATGVSATFRPWQRTKFSLGAGLEHHQGSSNSEALARIGFSYAFEVVPGNSVSPEINLDFVDGETLLVAGVTIGWGF